MRKVQRTITITPEMDRELNRIAYLYKRKLKKDISISELIERVFWLGIERFVEKYGLKESEEEHEIRLRGDIEQKLREFERIFGRPRFQLW